MSAATPADDERFMAEAIAVSRQHLGQTGTNPSVGCVIVRDGVILSRAATAIGGRPHAEPQALAAAGEAARGATAYVTLEPCSHYGHTPPCANALIAAGVGRVVVSVTDPDARVAGRGLAMLRAAGIVVDTGVMETEGRRSLAGYLMRQTKGRPYVTLKLAVSADGMIGRAGAGQVAITGPEARAAVQILRAECDAILVGIGTAIADDPLLTCRAPGLEKRSPIRIVLDRRLELPLVSKLAMTARNVPVIVVGSFESGALPPSVTSGDISPTRGEIAMGRRPDKSEPAKFSATGDGSDKGAEHAPSPISPLVGEMSAEPPEGGGRSGGEALWSDEPVDNPAALQAAALQAAGIEILPQDPADLATLLTTLGGRGISSLLVEGGARTARSFLDADLVDRILLFQAPLTIGAGGIESPLKNTDMPNSFTHVSSALYGADRCDFYEREP
ncbi:MAG: bifunctional diaminohydroxyphosphoribosylaminopyrimidine deaminase/5-amino-6-(5-phosphoribosylamino)uracil reductase RibD [Rhizobium sp.]